MAWLRTLLVLPLVWLSACQSRAREPLPLALPPLMAQRSAHWGSALSGAVAGAREPAQAGAPLPAAQVPALVWEVLALERWPAAWPQFPLERGAGLVLEAGEDQLLLPVSRLGTRVWRTQEGPVDALTTGRTRELFRERSALPLASTQLLELLPQAQTGALLGELARPQSLEVAVGRESSGVLRVLFRVEGEVLQVPHDLEDLLPGEHGEKGPAARPQGMREWIGLSEPLAQAEQGLSVLMRSPFDGEASALLVRIRMQPGDDSAEHAQAVQSAREKLVARSAEQQERVRTREEREARRQGIERALRSIARAQNRRAALSFVATSAAAPLAGDLAAAISEPELDRLLEALAAAGEPERLALEDSSLGWTLERVALEFVLGEADDEGLRGVWLARMSQRVGALAMSVEDVRELMQRSPTLASFEEQLRSENTIALEDSSASVRVRAFDWLQTRKAAPPAFDPLASEEVREDRIEALEEMQAGASEEDP
ncbi:MAG: hypothetical protein ACKO32_04920 [Planctomycetia bacterium]